ncbi:MAG TPA: hypothetical protein VGR35_22285 [Tepidisphaeraceae bacterium]|nr:hypothetical protein [Tepidisphaeraceae bacterium]
MRHSVPPHYHPCKWTTDSKVVRLVLECREAAAVKQVMILRTPEQQAEQSLAISLGQSPCRDMRII